MSSLTQDPNGLVVTPLTLHIGAEISDLDIKKSLPPMQPKAVRDALLEWKVLFFRAQHLDHSPRERTTSLISSVNLLDGFEDWNQYRRLNVGFAQ